MSYEDASYHVGVEGDKIVVTLKVGNMQVGVHFDKHHAIRLIKMIMSAGDLVATDFLEDI